MPPPSHQHDPSHLLDSPEQDHSHAHAVPAPPTPPASPLRPHPRVHHVHLSLTPPPTPAAPLHLPQQLSSLSEQISLAPPSCPLPISLAAPLPVSHRVYHPTHLRLQPLLVLPMHPTAPSQPPALVPSAPHCLALQPSLLESGPRWSPCCLPWYLSQSSNEQLPVARAPPLMPLQPPPSASSPYVSHPAHSRLRPPLLPPVTPPAPSQPPALAPSAPHCLAVPPSPEMRAASLHLLCPAWCLTQSSHEQSPAASAPPSTAPMKSSSPSSVSHSPPRTSLPPLQHYPHTATHTAQSSPSVLLMPPPDHELHQPPLPVTTAVPPQCHSASLAHSSSSPCLPSSSGSLSVQLQPAHSMWPQSRPLPIVHFARPPQPCISAGTPHCSWMHSP